MGRPTDELGWGTDGGAQIAEPSSGQKATGWSAGSRVVAHWLNWWMRGVARWISWLASSARVSLSSWSWAYKGANPNHANPGRLYANDIAVIGYQGAKTLASSDQKTFTIGSPLGSPIAIAFGNGVYVSLATNNISYSSDALTWSLGLSLATGYWVHFGNGIFVVCGSSSTIRTSVDGASWTTQTSANANNRVSTYFAGLHIIGGTSGELQTSPDGVTWTARTSGFGADRIRGFAIKGSTCIAFGDNGKLSTSTDGVTWTARTSGFGAVNILHGSANDTVFCIAGDGGNVSSSPDGITWTAAALSPFSTNNFLALDVCSNVFCAASVGDIVATSYDAKHWTQRTMPAGFTFNAGAGNHYGNVLGTAKQFLVSGIDGSLVMTDVW